MKKKFLLILIAIFSVLSIIGAVWYRYTLPPKIAILYIATGCYIIFWPEFYQSAEKNFLPEYEKHYYVFTDDDLKNKPENVTRIYRKWHGFPDDTQDRYEMFLSIEKELKKYDYIYYLNANAKVVGEVGEEILPTRKQGIMVVCSPELCRTKVRANYPYETNPKSTAYIAPDEGVEYVQGGFVGGRTKSFLQMSHTLQKNIQIDKQNGIKAIWDDESHLNRYIIGKEVLIMQPNYIWWLIFSDPVLKKQYTENNEFKITAQHIGNKQNSQ